MRQILIFGNSGAGKTTLALKLQVELSLPILDLDTITWIPDLPGVRGEDAESDAGRARCANSLWAMGTLQEQRLAVGSSY